jgi:hypothetical protein
MTPTLDYQLPLKLGQSFLTLNQYLERELLRSRLELFPDSAGAMQITDSLCAAVRLTPARRLFSINTEVHAGWCPSGTSNPAGLPLVDRSVRFRHTSAKAVRHSRPVEDPVASPENGAPLMSPRKPPKKEPFRAWKEVKRQARERIGTPRPTKREENARGKPPKHRKRELEAMEEET